MVLTVSEYGLVALSTSPLLCNHYNCPLVHFKHTHIGWLGNFFTFLFHKGMEWFSSNRISLAIVETV